MAGASTRSLERELYVVRDHDRQLNLILRSQRPGNYLLAGPIGSGKSSALSTLSDELIANGTEHSLVPCQTNREFAPPFARINLIDDIDTLAVTGYANKALIDAVNVKRPPRINIITTRNAEVGRLTEMLSPEAVITIHPFSREETGTLLSKFYNGERIETLIGHGLYAAELYPKMLVQLLEAVQVENSPVLQYQSLIPKSGLELVRPQLIAVKSSLIARLRDQPHDLRTLSPIEFEHLIGELFQKEGYKVDFTKQSRDGGVDIFAWRKDIAGEHLTVVQCKRHIETNPVRVGVVREVVGTMNIHNATAAALFTTSRFTKAALDESKQIRHRLSLNDYFDILKSIAKH